MVCEMGLSFLGVWDVDAEVERRGWGGGRGIGLWVEVEAIGRGGGSMDDEERGFLRGVMVFASCMGCGGGRRGTSVVVVDVGAMGLKLGADVVARSGRGGAWRAMNALSSPLDRGFESKAATGSKAGRGVLRVVVVESGFVEIVVVSEMSLTIDDVATDDTDGRCSPTLRGFAVCVCLEPDGPFVKGLARDDGLMELNGGRVFLGETSSSPLTEPKSGLSNLGAGMRGAVARGLGFGGAFDGGVLVSKPSAVARRGRLGGLGSWRCALEGRNRG